MPPLAAEVGQPFGFPVTPEVMPKPPPLPGCLVIVELGAEWPDAAVRESGLYPRRVVAEVEGEGPTAFAARVAAVTARLFPPGVTLSRVVVACNERSDVAAMGARRAAARELLSSSRPRSLEILFAASERTQGRLRHALSALAADLSLPSGAPVSVRFGVEAGVLGVARVARVA